MEGRQIKSKKRVADHGEVFTNEREVKAMVNLVWKELENKLPTGSEYYEADINYRCGKRTADRIVFNKKGDIWITKDHYKTFDKQ